MPSAAAFEFLTQVTIIFKLGAQCHALMRYALDKVSHVESGMIIVASSYLTKKQLRVSGTSFFSKI